MKHWVLGLFMVCGPVVQAQYWRALGRGTVGPTEVQTLFGDPGMDRLLAGGTFMRIMNVTDTVLVMGQAAWNGSRWDSIAHRIQPIIGNNSTDQTFWFLRFGDLLYSCGNYAFMVEPGTWNSSFARLNESTQHWEALECVNSTTSGLVTLVPRSPGGALYATGYKGTLCGYPQSNVFHYDGQAFYEWPPFAQIPYDPGDYVGYVFDYQGYTYMTGSFRDPLSANLAYFMRYNGTTWEYVPGWGTAAGSIKDILIHNDTLYVAGAFTQAQGAPGNHIAYFDGSTRNDMGGGLAHPSAPQSAAAVGLEWWHDALYACGQFTQAGGVVVNKIAKWNGWQWCGLPGQLNANAGYLYDMAIWRDSLYICGGFSSIDGAPIRQVAQWIGGDATTDCSTPTSVVEQAPSETGLIATPLPGGAAWMVTVPYTGAWDLRVVDAVGRQVRSYPRQTQPVRVDLEGQAPGLYVLQGTGANGQTHFLKIMKH